MTTNYSYVEAPNVSIKTANGTVYAYRELGEKMGIPVIFFTHLSANLDNWDPRVVDGIAKKHWVIAFDNKGVGLSSGKVPDTIEQMARDALTFVHTLGFEQIDILSFSMGG
ncbi:alpha/beta hydrolase [Paenibacillus sp. 19GGS1-52]|uniref:alpha/beta fold hydrolase n=1 Tax=Paenibacillus sp. 19GGS1-52 TaxID=2758563 RepID=UPI001EFC2D14|nr:alpha/beta hydrolase [Paenibacillus sp. 19GGS1-52]